MVRSVLVAQQVSASLAPGTRLKGRYRIQEPIGSGGYASVYRAIDERSGQECAIKELLDPDPAVRNQFHLEADLLIRAPHQYIPKGYDLIDDRNRMYMVMEYIRGKDLEELLNDSLVNRGRALDEPQVLRWMIQICDALIAMHNQPVPIIHRDIKPANIKITPDGRPVLIDFGLAKQQRAGNPTMTAAQGVSPGFAPPEQYMAKGRTDARTDVYALGATLYACLTGKDPPEAPARLLAQTGARGNGGAALKLARSINPRISEPTDRIISKSLELSPMQRHQAARTLQTELKQSLAALTGATTGSVRAVQTCARCGMQNRPDATECVTCGALLPGASNPSAKRAAVAKNGANGAGNGGNGSYPGKAGIGATGAHAARTPESWNAKPAASPNGKAGKQAAAGAVRRTVKEAAVAAESRSGKQAALGRTANQAAMAPERTAKHVAVPPDPRTAKHAAASVAPRTGQQAVVAPPRTGRQPVVAPRADFAPAPGLMGAAGGGALAMGPGPGRAGARGTPAAGPAGGGSPWQAAARPRRWVAQVASAGRAAARGSGSATTSSACSANGCWRSLASKSCGERACWRWAVW